LNAVFQVYCVFSYGWLVWMFKMYAPLMLLQPGVHIMACLPTVDLATLTRDSALKMEAIRSFETSVNQGSTLRHIWEDDILHSHCCAKPQILHD
jgi:hypothetical protein